MSTSPIVPCIWFDDQAEAAADFYTRAFPRGRVLSSSRYPESTDNPGHKPPGSVLTVEFEIAGQRFCALNGGPEFTPTPSVSFFVDVLAAEEADKLFALLAEGGKVLMPIDTYPWSDRYGWVQDRFGVSWQVNTTSAQAEATAIAPCLMFSDEQRGRAEEAMKLFTAIFPDSRVDMLQRYPEGQPAAGLVVHARFTLSGQPMAATDSPIDHGFAFNEALSFQVMCADQVEVDRYWERLSEGGSQGPCGWLKDRFGLSWQIVPTQMQGWLTAKDTAARERAFAAMMTMGKIDIARIEAAAQAA